MIMSIHSNRTLLPTIALMLLLGPSAFSADEKTLPASLSGEQRENLLKFLTAHETPERYVPKGAKVIDAAPLATESEIVATADKPIKQFIAQITPHRPVPGEEAVTKADVYFYRPNPIKGRQGLTVKYTVDLKTGQPIGETELLTKAHMAISREELAEAVALAKEKVPAVQSIYKDRAPSEVRWEHLQMKINRKSADYEPGDRVIRFVFMANALEGQPAPTPVRVVVNLTKDLVIQDNR
jgi:hypothetical protein